jgi:predicted transporter
VTEGTTRYVAMINVNAAGTAATREALAVVFPEPVPFAALSWSVVDNGADTDIEGTTLGDTSGVKVMIVYAE